MTDRVKGFYVALDRDYRIDDVQIIIDAVKMIKGVLDVKENIADSNDWMNRELIRMEIHKKLYEALKK